MQVKSELFTDDLVGLSHLAKALSHPARLEILRVIAQKDTCICGEIVDDLPLAQSTVSRHLKVLKEAGLIQGTIDGPSVCYCIDLEALRLLRERFSIFFSDVFDYASDTTSC